MPGSARKHREVRSRHGWWRRRAWPGLLLLVVLGCASGEPLAPAIGPPANGAHSAPFTDLRGEAARLLGGAIRIPTANPPGGEAALANWLAQTLRQVEGVESRVIHLEAHDRSRAALWARVRGRGLGRPLLLLSHLDVVPTVREEWALNPFAGVIGGGYVVGRGALDAKGVTVVHLLTLVALARAEVKPARDVILLATPDEEDGGRHGAMLVTRHRSDLLGDAEFLLSEGGGIQPGGAGGLDIWGVSFTEKTPCWMELRARGVPGHSALGAGLSATGKLIRALAALSTLEFPLRVTPVVETMFESLAPLAPPADRAHYRELRRALATRPAFRARFLSDPGRAALVRNTLAVTTLEGSPRVNMTPAHARAQLDARLLPGENCGDFVASLRAKLDDPALMLHVLLEFEASASPPDSALMDAISRVAARSTPRGVVIPRVNTGSGDTHWFRELGIAGYGFVPRRLRPIETLGVHGPNERIAIDNLVFGVETMLEIIEELER